jgi:hypothetical protein
MTITFVYSLVTWRMLKNQIYDDVIAHYDLRLGIFLVSYF